MTTRLVYVQETGKLYLDGARIALCYSGMAENLDNPGRDWLASTTNAGPLPKGIYTPVAVNVPHLGGDVFRLDPDPLNQMHGRSAFFIHWDNQLRNFSASEGCIVPIDFPTAHARILAALPCQLRVCANDRERGNLTA